MIVVDSSVWIDFFNGKDSEKTDLLDRLIGQERIVISDFILTKVLQGFQRDKDFQLAKSLLDTLEFKSMAGKEIAHRSVENYRKLCSKGVKVRKTNYVIIGTFCILNSYPLLHDNHDFDPMEKYLGLNMLKP
ncbi:MAG: PIN domain nuclease [Magnetococcales bacterium]|nr:PIN domain nuclease [Magnetococcales bacterium]